MKAEKGKVLEFVKLWIVIICASDNECVNVKVLVKNAPLWSDAANVNNHVNVYELENIFDCVWHKCTFMFVSIIKPASSSNALARSTEIPTARIGLIELTEFPQPLHGAVSLWATDLTKATLEHQHKYAVAPAAK